MNAMDSCDDSDGESMSTEMLEGIRDGSQSHPNNNIREVRYKIRNCIKQRQLEWKGSLKLRKTWVKLHTGCLRLL